MSRNVLITGAGGFVGTCLAEGLARAGLSVTGLDARFDSAARARLSGSTLIECDLAQGMPEDLGRFDIVIHGAAVTTSPEDFGLSPVAHLKLNCDLTFTALDFATRCGASDFVFISSSGVFGADDGEDVLLEDMAATASIPYALAKRAGEMFVEGLSGPAMRAISIRLGPIYGEAEAVRETRRNLSPMRRWIDAGRRGAPVMVESPASHRDWTYGPDLPHALLALLDREPAISGVYHLTSGEAIADMDLARRIAAAFDVGVIAHDPPAFAARKPMSSTRIAPGALYGWTPLATGLSRMMEAAR
ncbi:Nucleoside-diphosphate-sugar epimerase [Devosia enhydra]|uniref:Nucleoside-diphosphate-sugar epimerase n=1 Tax=Devosia enhydra TaxID=665118 RepID=A0A1K2HV61_9HYPH|nr:NAD(P)-dependent oxidoreductase [Devosia enhydra]SFZ82544.1 Nucleoside-diphosphate-sugar epimerase [Devosia enhydra]